MARAAAKARTAGLSHEERLDRLASIAVRVGLNLKRGQDVVVTAPVALADVASVHVDEEGAEAVVGIAVDALPAADAGDDDARFALDEAEAHELLWYDVTEIPDLV